MIPLEERRHLTDGPRPGELPGGAGTVSVVARSSADGGLVLERSQAVMSVVLKHSGQDWPSEREWKLILPQWFVTASGSEISREDTERWLTWWRTLEPADKARVEREQNWTLSSWLYWLKPSERQWFWWDAEVRADRSLRVTVQVLSRPTALGSLDWLLYAAGAVEVDHEES